jgi:hypothetical protein
MTKIPLLAIALLLSSELPAQRPGTTTMQTKADTTDLTPQIQNFSKTRRANGIYDLYTYSDGAKVKAEVNGGRVTGIQVFDASNNQVPPQMMRRQTDGHGNCWLNMKLGNRDGCIRIPCKF